MGRLVIVSNRLPSGVAKRKGKLQFSDSVGGLATGLSSFYESYDSVWIGWPGIGAEKINQEEKEAIRAELSSKSCRPVFLSDDQVENYYHGFSNRTIWPLFHYFPIYAQYLREFWDHYKRVNEIFSEVVLETAQSGDQIWIHDYQLMLLPGLIRNKMPDATIGFFLHIPFPSFEVFRLAPWRQEILEGILGADLVGFHTYDYVQHFLNSVRRLLGYEHTFGQVSAGRRLIKADAFPMGIEYERFAEAVGRDEVQKEAQRILKNARNRKIVLSIDRLDYTKGILQRLEVFDKFLEKNPDYKEKVVLVLVAVPSRTKVDHYRLLKKQVDEVAGRINGRHGTMGWVPVLYLYRSLPFDALVALYKVADVALVTPLRDGMNLIAKEFVATKTDGKGVLILSEMAGAAKELGEALIINPNNMEEVVAALEEALLMPVQEQEKRNLTMQERLQRYDVKRWAKDFVDNLSLVKKLQDELYATRLSKEIRRKVHDDYHKSGKRLILLDYDGTLVSFAEEPDVARPDAQLLRLLRTLSENRQNKVVIISGRKKERLTEWFNDLDLELVAEHAAWMRKNGDRWEAADSLKSEWKDEIRPTLELYVDRTPGSFIEEKDYSLVWHYRKADLELAIVRARELSEDLMHLTSNRNLAVLEGSKVIEVKNAAINKGHAAMRYIGPEWDFILAIGDDWTDEDVFAVLPPTAYSIKVGLGPSKARYNIDSFLDVRSLLNELVR